MTRMETIVYGKADPDTGVRDLGMADKVQIMWRYGWILYGAVCVLFGIFSTVVIQKIFGGDA